MRFLRQYLLECARDHTSGGTTLQSAQSRTARERDSRLRCSLRALSLGVQGARSSSFRVALGDPGGTAQRERQLARSGTCTKVRRAGRGATRNRFQSDCVANRQRRDGANDGRAVAWRDREVPVGRPPCFGRANRRWRAPAGGASRGPDGGRPGAVCTARFEAPGGRQSRLPGRCARGAQGCGDPDGAETRGLSQSVDGVMRAVRSFDCRRTRWPRRGVPGRCGADAP